MNLEIIWSEFAEKQLELIFEYYQKKASDNVARNLIRSIIKEPNRLINEPFIGQEETLLKNRKFAYRYLTFKSYKIIYSVDEKNGWIKIADVFDTRQHPIKIKRSR